MGRAGAYGARGTARHESCPVDFIHFFYILTGFAEMM